MGKAEPLVVAWSRAHPDLAVRLRAIQSRSPGIGKYLAPAVVDEDHQLRDELVERARAQARNDAHAPGLDRSRILIPVDVEAVIDTREIGLAADRKSTR